MKTGDMTIFFCAFLLLVLAISFKGVNDESKIMSDNTEFSTILTSACYDAAQAMPMGNVGSHGRVWITRQDLTDTVDAFYTSLSYSLSLDTIDKKDEISLYTPVVCLVDMDGYYISYDTATDDSGQTVNADLEMEKRTGITGIHTWTAAVNAAKPVVVRFYLSDMVTVYASDGNAYTGDKELVAEVLQKKSPTDLHYSKSAADKGNPTLQELLLNTNGKFYEFRDKLLVEQIQAQCEYYINRRNIVGGRKNKEYTYEMPAVAGEDWSRLLERPTVISFLQGYPMEAGTLTVNTYALAGGELTENELYFIEDTVYTDTEGNPFRYYHRLETDEVIVHAVTHEKADGVIEVTGRYYYGGEEIKNTYATQTLCAERGAYPHECVYDKNINAAHMIDSGSTGTTDPPDETEEDVIIPPGTEEGDDGTITDNPVVP